MDDIVKKIDFILDKTNSAFDRVMPNLIEEYEKKFDKNIEWRNETKKKIDSMMKAYNENCANAKDDEYIEPPETSMDYIDLAHENNGSYFFEKYWNEELLALHEMQIVYCFKQIEIGLKHFLVILDPDIDPKTIQRWDDLKKELNIRGIRIGSVDGYQAINQLREVNNALKHSLEVSEKVKRLNVVEFENSQHFTYETLGEFYKRVDLESDGFMEEVAELVEARAVHANST